MRTCSSTRNLCPGRSSFAAEQRGLAPAQSGLVRAAVCLALAGCIAVTVGCSDDVVCPDATSPYISARVKEVGAARAGSTYVEVYCSNDPLPGTFNVSVSERQLPEGTEAEDRLGLVTSLSDTLIVWQPGTNCLLEVTTEFGIASALETVPGTFEVDAPGTLSIDETLTLTWSESQGAAYYVVEAWLATGALDPHGTGEATVDPRGDGEPVLDIAVEGTSASFGPTELPGMGVLTGRVWAVTGPFPEAGAVGNVTGGGWGYLTVSYRDAGGEFEVVLEDDPAD
jgi:hypothetical protein